MSMPYLQVEWHVFGNGVFLSTVPTQTVGQRFLAPAVSLECQRPLGARVSFN